MADGRFVPEFRQCLLRRAVAQFGLVAEREQRLGAAGGLARTGDRQDFLGREIGRMAG